MAELKFIQLYLSYIDAMGLLTDAERGRLVTELMEYAVTGKAQEVSGNEKYLYAVMRSQIDRDSEEYENKCRKNSSNGSLGGRPKKANGFLESERFLEKPKKAKKKEKEKEKEKEKDISPNGDSAREGDLFSGRPFSSSVQATVSDWLKYKAERREGYKPTGLGKLLSQIENKLAEYSDEQVIFAISESMACNYQGIIWDKIKSIKPPPPSTGNSVRDMLERGEFD